MVQSTSYRPYADGGLIEMDIGIFTDCERAEVITAQCENWDRDLKIKTFCQPKTWSEGVRPWFIGSEVLADRLGLKPAGSGALNALYLHALYQYPRCATGSKRAARIGIAPAAPYCERLLPPKRLADASAQSIDPGER